MGVKQQSGNGNRELRSAEEAAVWLQRLRVEDTPEVRAEFSAWVREGAKNLEEFLFAQALWKEMDQISPAMRERLWSAEIRGSVVPFPNVEPAAPVLERAPSISRSDHPVTAGRRRQFFGAAAAALLCALTGATWWAATRNTYATDVGEQMSVKLPDGSMMHLNTDSRAVVDYTDQGRAIRLESGEALFTVARDARRPFDVMTASAKIRALGTEFNVRSRGNETRVAVVEGAVQVSAPGKAPNLQLRAGDEAQVAPKKILKTNKPNIERAVSWRARRLMFPGDPVSEIAEEFNRYNKTAIRIEGADLQKRRMSGVFDADDPSPLLRFLERDPAVEVLKNGDEILIRGR